SLNNPSPWQEDKTSLRLWKFDDFEFDPMLGCRIGGVFARVSLIHIGDLHRLASLGLHSLGKFSDLSAILLFGGFHTQREQVPQGIDRKMNFIAFAALGSVIAGASAAFYCRL